jgi:hypothetical protein
MLNWHRFDLTESSLAIALMAEVTPAWRELYSDMLDRLTARYTTYWAAKDWNEQIGPDPDRSCYPDAFFPAIIPTELRGKYDKPGWANNGAEPWGLEPDPCNAVGALNYKSFLHLQLAEGSVWPKKAHAKGAVEGVQVGCFPDLYAALAANPPDQVITL